MSFWDKFSRYWRNEIKYSASDPSSFEEKWSFISSRTRLASLIILSLIGFSVLSTYLVVWGPLSGIFMDKEKTIERIELEQQMVQIEGLEEEIKNQEVYIANLQAVLLGKISPEELKDKKNLQPVDVKTLDTRTTADELELSENIKNEMRQGKEEKLTTTDALVAPIKGVISQGFDKAKHPALDLVAKKDEVVNACQSGVVLYSGYSKKDGYFTILQHADGLLSIYKHFKVNLKKNGQRVGRGDAIGIVGNSGENSTGPHLHFELWQNQRPVDPTKLIKFSAN